MRDIILFIYLFIFRQRGKEGEREGEKHQCWLPLTHPHLGALPTTQAFALTGNWTHDPLVCRLALNSLSHTSQGSICFLKITSVVLFSNPTAKSSATHKSVKCFKRGGHSEYEQRNDQLRGDKHCEKQYFAFLHSLPAYLSCHKRNKNTRRNQVTFMYTSYCP